MGRGGTSDVQAKASPTASFCPCRVLVDITAIRAPGTSIELSGNCGKSLASDTHPLPRSSIKPPPPETRTKNNWFIQNVLSTQPVAAVAPPPTLADILARDPPPLPHEPQHSPPIWLAIGPSNKGYEMLQNRGWNEGEALGIGVLRANRMRPEPEVIDLTEPDRDPESDDYSEPEIASASGSSSRTALVTPIATVLKSDRLGIGLKAKTVGPYRASQKRVTHNAAAMLAHVKAAEELRKQKRRYGRGYRGHARQEKAQNRQRREMLAYLNEP
ncbi:unnamed protein product [Mycena citricolor]|uniref:G-patch domain-containing protein n=1 Tax=Mycena citricolor TaxID=2018698 RepID=A0AAD2HZF7_9AGAR|nr:unnamed protein product [Mycena citricolor]